MSMCTLWTRGTKQQPVKDAYANWISVVFLRKASRTWNKSLKRTRNNKERLLQSTTTL